MWAMLSRPAPQPPADGHGSSREYPGFDYRFLKRRPLTARPNKLAPGVPNVAGSGMALVFDVLNDHVPGSLELEAVSKPSGLVLTWAVSCLCSPLTIPAKKSDVAMLSEPSSPTVTPMSQLIILAFASVEMLAKNGEPAVTLMLGVRLVIVSETKRFPPGC